MYNIANIKCYPDKAQYFPGETVKILMPNLNLDNTAQISITISELDKVIYTQNIVAAQLSEKAAAIDLEQDFPLGNYGVDIRIVMNKTAEMAHTAFDVAASCEAIIRYGFLTDFTDKDEQDCSDIDYAVMLHLNALQFYDWMYRHDELVSDKLKYKEPLGRDISLQTVKNKIQACRERGIRPFAYGAVYSASKEAYARHPDWAFRKKNKDTLTYADWLVFMDTSQYSPWRKHIIGEYTKAVALLGFQGIQMDTYGFPKFAWNSRQERISLAGTFADLINKAKAAVKAVDDKAGVIFNAVNNWPAECIAASDQDAVYIEVWPPHVTYYHLYSLIREAKYLGKKNVILAAYIEAFKDTKTEEEFQAAENSFLLANAVIQASGGTQIVLGETNGILKDSYFVNYAVLRDEFIKVVKSYCDFTVRYGKLLYDSKAMDISMTAVNGINTDICLTAEEHADILFSSCGEGGKIWSIVRETDKYLIIQLINLYGVDEFWNRPKYRQPDEIQDIQADILLDADIQAVCYATPDDGSGTSVTLYYKTEQRDNGQHLLLKIPRLIIWDLIWIELI